MTGDVPSINEIGGMVNLAFAELVKGVPTQSKFQFSVNGVFSRPFNIVNDTTAAVSWTI